jgi:hypothetical protein
MVEHVPLDASGDPGSQHSYQRRLDHRLSIDKVVVVGLILCRKDPASDLRQYTGANILILQVDGLVALVHPLAGEALLHRIGVDSSLRALVSTAEVEPGVLIRLPGQVCRQSDVLFPDPGARRSRRLCTQQAPDTRQQT